MSRVAIIGSCITRDLWPILGEDIEGLLYISRTSLPSLLAPALTGFSPQAEPPGGLTRSQHRWVVSDLLKGGLEALVAHRPTHIIFDFIDERFDLLAVAGSVVTHSWELELSGYLADPALAGARVVPRLSAGAERLWMEAVGYLAQLIAATPLREAAILLHESQWAQAYLDDVGERRAFGQTAIWGDRIADAERHNALLRTYQAAFRAALPQAMPIAADAFRTGDAGHRWGLTPFHYVPQYYEEIWRQLREAGV